MEARGESQPDTSCSSFSWDGSGVSVSREVLTAGSVGHGGIRDKLVINSKPNSRKNSTLQKVRKKRSPLLDQVQSFLPQMAQANEKLRKEMAAAPPGHFNIENIDTLGKVMQMVMALFEMNQSDSKEEDSSEENSQGSSEDSSEFEDEDDSTSSEGEVTIDTIKLPNSEDGKGKIEVLDRPASEKKENRDINNLRNR
nr:NOP protein chaperone 1-like [Globicephala melas]